MAAPDVNAGPPDPEAEEAEREFVKGLRARGEVAEMGEADGQLPPGATHEVVVEGDTDDDHEEPTVRRRRFSAF